MIFCAQLCPHVCLVYICVGEEVYKGMIWTRTVSLCVLRFWGLSYFVTKSPKGPMKYRGKWGKT